MKINIGNLLLFCSVQLLWISPRGRNWLTQASLGEMGVLISNRPEYTEEEG